MVFLDKKDPRKGERQRPHQHMDSPPPEEVELSLTREEKDISVPIRRSSRKKSTTRRSSSSQWNFEHALESIESGFNRPHLASLATRAEIRSESSCPRLCRPLCSFVFKVVAYLLGVDTQV